MKKTLAMLLAIMMLLSLSVPAFADDGTSSISVTVEVPAATYTVHIPEDSTKTLSTVLTNSADDSVTDGKGALIGKVEVTDVSNCRLVACAITPPVLKNGDDVLPCQITAQGFYQNTGYDEKTLDPIDTLENFVPSASKFPSAKHDETFRIYPYRLNRQLKLIEILSQLDLNGNPATQDKTISCSYADTDLYLWIAAEDTANVVSGSYTGTMTFTFTSSNVYD